MLSDEELLCEANRIQFGFPLLIRLVHSRRDRGLCEHTIIGRFGSNLLSLIHGDRFQLL